MMFKGNKGTAEFKTFTWSIFFMLILNLFIGYVIDPDDVSNYNQEQAIQDITNGMGTILSWGVGAILSIADVFFSLFGIDFIFLFTELPIQVTVILTVVNVLAVISVVMYLVDRLWIG